MFDEVWLSEKEVGFAVVQTSDGPTAPRSVNNKKIHCQIVLIVEHQEARGQA